MHSNRLNKYSEASPNTTILSWYMNDSKWIKGKNDPTNTQTIRHQYHRQIQSFILILQYHQIVRQAHLIYCYSEINYSLNSRSLYLVSYTHIQQCRLVCMQILVIASITCQNNINNFLKSLKLIQTNKSTNKRTITRLERIYSSQNRLLIQTTIKLRNP